MKGRCVKGAIVAALALVFVAETPRLAEAIPAWARKLGASCNLCHYPNVPRLNAYGQHYRNAGFRTEDEMNKFQDITKVGDFVSLRARVRYTYRNREGQPDQNAFTLNDVTFFYAGALAKNFSAFSEVEIEQDGEVAPLGTIFGYYGDWGNFGSFRMGQMHTLTRVGWGGFDRPTGISTPLVLSTAFTQTFGGAPYRINADERGLELAYVYGNSKLLGQVLNGVNSSGSGTSSSAFTSNDKDFLLAYQYILGDIASGLTLFGYRGQVLDVPEDTDEVAARIKFFRFGLSLDYVFDCGFEIQSGYVRGIDYKPENFGGNFSSQGGWVEFEQYFQDPGITPFTRFDWINPKLGGSGGDTVWQLQGTLGFAMTLQDFLRLSLEGQVLDDQFKDTTNYSVVAELMANF